MLFDCERCTAERCAECVDGSEWRDGMHPGISETAWAVICDLLGGEPDGYAVCKEAQ